ncbi:MAG: hypothetical protein JWP78_1363 [Mucilaginibacter sp.]|nr:hypothetical protein [Mucilaginibacter sp.]
MITGAIAPEQSTQFKDDSKTIKTEEKYNK